MVARKRLKNFCTWGSGCAYIFHPEWVLDYRLKAFRHWQTMTEPAQAANKWAEVKYPPIDFQDLTYYSAPKAKKVPKTSMDEIDPELIKTFERLGIPLSEQKRISGVAVDVVFDSVSIATTHNEELENACNVNKVSFTSMQRLLESEKTKKLLKRNALVQQNIDSEIDKAIENENK